MKFWFCSTCEIGNPVEVAIIIMIIILHIWVSREYSTQQFRKRKVWCAFSFFPVLFFLIIFFYVPTPHPLILSLVGITKIGDELLLFLLYGQSHNPVTLPELCLNLFQVDLARQIAGVPDTQKLSWKLLLLQLQLVSFEQHWSNIKFAVYSYSLTINSLICHYQSFSSSKKTKENLSSLLLTKCCRAG